MQESKIVKGMWQTHIHTIKSDWIGQLPGDVNLV